MSREAQQRAQSQGQRGIHAASRGVLQRPPGDRETLAVLRRERQRERQRRHQVLSSYRLYALRIGSFEHFNSRWSDTYSFAFPRPLHEAAENGATELVRLLLSYGADPLLATYSGQTPLMLAVDTEANAILEQHLDDIQGRTTVSWSFAGPACVFGMLEIVHSRVKKNSLHGNCWHSLQICFQIQRRRATIHWMPFPWTVPSRFNSTTLRWK